MRPTPLLERLKACLEKHPEWDDARIAAAIVGSGIENVRSVRAGGPLVTPVEEEKPEPPRPSIRTVTLEQVCERYDIAAAIRRELGKFVGELVLERDLAILAAGKDSNRFRRAVENNIEEFSKNRLKMALPNDPPEGRWYWSDAKTIAEAVRKRDEFGK